MITDYIGIPYLDKGQTKAGCDCWGLVQLYFSEVHHKILPDFVGLYQKDLTKELPHLLEEISEKDIKKDDIVLLRAVGRGLHCGIYLGNKKMLHSHNNDSHIVSLAIDMWKDRILTYFRVLND